MPGPESKANPIPAGTLQSAKSLAELTVERGYCTAEQISKAREKQRAGGNKELGETLIEMGFLTKEQAQACKRAMSGKTIIGNFEILEKVGQGGMGAVFRARQISMDRIVAIKILPPKLAENPSFQKRFINEARVSAKLSHLNIINGIDCGEANGYTYFAMEFVDGRTIKDVMKEKGKFSPPEAIKIIRQMVEALAYAKSQGLVHRDVKPDNIMLTSNGVAKLCDLGLAKHIESNDDASLTQSGQAVGTPHYIAPEQARGEPVDFNSDIYSLGATFYHMLTGKTPFHGPTSAAVMALHIANDTRSPCDIEPTIPIGYGQVISKMMAKEKAERYPTPEGLLSDLDALEDGKIPSAAHFKGKSSTLMPKSTPTSRTIRGRTTGPMTPVDERPQTSARLPKTGGRGMSMIGPVCAAAIIVIAVVAYVMSKNSNQTPAPANNKTVAQNEPPKDTKAHEPKANKTEAKPDAPATPVTPAPEQTSTKPAPPPEPVAPAHNEEPKPKPPEVVATKEPAPKPEITPPAPPPAEVKPVPPAPEPEKKEVVAAPVKFEPTPDMLYARFLSELLKRTPTADLSKVAPEVKKLAADPIYSKISAETQREIDGINDSIKFENESLAAIAKRGGEVELTGPKALAKKGTVVGYDGEHGLNVKISDGLEMSLKAMDLGPDQLLAGHADAALPRRMEYMLLRAHTSALNPLLDKLDAKDKPIWERKLRLLADAEREIKAKDRYDQISKTVEAKDWKQVEPQVTDFQKNFGSTELAQENAATINGWLAQANKELNPPNPWKKVFHCTTSRDLPDGSIELYYDFAKTPEAAADFAANPGQAVVGDQHLVIEKGEDNKGFEQLFFNVPIMELRLISLTFKVPHRKSGCRIGFQAPENGLFLNAVAEINPRAGVGLVNERKHIDWNEMNFGEETDFSGKPVEGKQFNWTLAGKDLGNTPAPEFHGMTRFGMAAWGTHCCWSKFKIVFKPELKWLGEHSEGAQKDRGERDKGDRDRQPKSDK